MPEISLKFHSFQQQSALFSIFVNNKPLTHGDSPLMLELYRSLDSRQQYRVGTYLVFRFGTRWHEIYYQRLPEEDFQIVATLIELAHNNNLHSLIKD